jgi:hypothetical protein
MQPITQDSHGLSSNDIGHRQADQSVVWTVVTIPGFQVISQIVRILPPLLTWDGTKLGHSKPQCFGDSRDSKNDSILGARREM